MKENKQAMKGLFSRSGIDLSEDRLDRFWVFYQRLVERNPESDLTRLVTFEDIVVKHFVDSIMAGQIIDLPSPLLDIGTGAGFPALPLLIMDPGLEMILAEPRGRRISFLMEMIETLGIDNARVYPHKVSADFPLVVAGVITRALEAAAETLIRCAPFLDSGVRVILMKGPAAREEIGAITNDALKYFRLAEDIPYAIPNTPYERRLLVFERTDQEWVSERMGGNGKGRAVDIVSGANRHFKEFKRILSGRGLKKEGRAIVSGKKVVDEVVRDFPADIVGWIGAGDRDERPAALSGVLWYRLSGPLFHELDVHGTGGPLVLVRVPALPAWEDSEKNAGLTLFIPFQDPANVGAVIRSAAAFGASRVVLLLGAANPYHHKAVRAAGADLFRVPLLRGPSIEELVVTKPSLFTMAAGGDNIAKTVLPRDMGLLVGVEGPGVPRRFTEKRTIGIPMEEGTESLNAAVAASVAMFEWYRRHHTK